MAKSTANAKPDAGKAPETTKPDPESGPPTANAKPDAGKAVERFDVVVARTCALGDGTLKVHSSIGSLTAGEDGSPNWESFEPAEGVSKHNVDTLLKNRHLLRAVPVSDG